jgi:hypothetical protein
MAGRLRSGVEQLEAILIIEKRGRSLLTLADDRKYGWIWIKITFTEAIHTARWQVSKSNLD